MFGNMGYGELILIGFLALLLFGAKRLPEIGQSLGKSIRMFKKSVKDLQDEIPSQDDFTANDRPPKRNTYSSSSGTTSESSTQNKSED